MSVRIRTYYAHQIHLYRNFNVNPMEVKTYYPKHPILKEHIAYYYFLEEDSSFSSSYYAFPQTLQSFNIHKGAKGFFSEGLAEVKANGDNTFQTIIQGKFLTPLRVELTGPINKITIVFKPLGINQFLPHSFQKLAPLHSQVFTAWNADPFYKEFLKAFFSTFHLEKRIELLESYLITKFQPLPQTALLQKVITYLTDFDNAMPIPAIADRLALTEKTLNRTFQKHLGITPVSYRKIARFRHALSNRILLQEFTSLTSLGYESNFYDQAYFTNIYKQLTGESPKRFFKSMQLHADQNLVFRHIEEFE